MTLPSLAEALQHLDEGEDDGETECMVPEQDQLRVSVPEPPSSGVRLCERLDLTLLTRKVEVAPRHEAAERTPEERRYAACMVAGYVHGRINAETWAPLPGPPKPVRIDYAELDRRAAAAKRRRAG